MNKNKKEKNVTGNKNTRSPKMPNQQKPATIDLSKASPIQLPMVTQILMELRLPVS